MFSRTRRDGLRRRKGRAMGVMIAGASNFARSAAASAFKAFRCLVISAKRSSGAGSPHRVHSLTSVAASYPSISSSWIHCLCLARTSCRFNQFEASQNSSRYLTRSLLSSLRRRALLIKMLIIYPFAEASWTASLSVKPSTTKGPSHLG